MSKLEVLVDIMTGYVGPFAKNVIKHQMKLLGMPPENHTVAEIRTLGEKVITVSVFDVKLQEMARKDLKKALYN